MATLSSVDYALTARAYTPSGSSTSLSAQTGYKLRVVITDSPSTAGDTITVTVTIIKGTGSGRLADFTGSISATDKTTQNFSGSYNTSGGNDVIMTKQFPAYAISQGSTKSVTVGVTFVAYENNLGPISVPNKAVTLAPLAPTTFAVTFSNANGTNGNSSISGLTAPATITFPNPGSRIGYNFVKWGPVVSPETGLIGTTSRSLSVATTYTSEWQTASYAISYNANGGSGSMSDTTWSYPNSGTVASNSFTRTGYTFAGWVNGSGNPVAVGATYTTSVALTATWTGNTGTVYYNGNGSDGGSTANTTWTYPATSGIVRANGFTRTGYTFARWNTAANGSGTDYYPNGSTPADGTTLYAIWGVLAVYPSFTDTTVLSPATMGTAYSDGVSASNTSSYSITSGAIPTGLSFNTSTGAITGTPTAQGVFSFSVRATSSTANTADSGNLTITVYPPGKRPDTNTRLTTAKRLSGSTWVNLTIMKRFDGSNWVNITNT